MLINTEILIEENLWKKKDKSIKEFIKSLIKKVLPEIKLPSNLPAKIELEISILLTNDKEIQKLNKTYRDKDSPTNVLSFPAINYAKSKNSDLKNLNQLSIIDNLLPLGDIALSYDTINRESLAQSKTFKNHLTHLIIHSILHLIGYDHINTKEAVIMENLEVKILKKLDIDNPYIISGN